MALIGVAVRPCRGSVRHVEVLQMGSVTTSIIGRSPPLPRRPALAKPGRTLTRRAVHLNQAPPPTRSSPASTANSNTSHLPATGAFTAAVASEGYSWQVSDVRCHHAPTAQAECATAMFRRLNTPHNGRFAKTRSKPYHGCNVIIAPSSFNPQHVD